MLTKTSRPTKNTFSDISIHLKKIETVYTRVQKHKGWENLFFLQWGVLKPQIKHRLQITSIWNKSNFQIILKLTIASASN